MNFLLVAAVTTNLLFHPWWEEGHYPNGDTWWLKAHTTTNAPSFHIQGEAEYGWTAIEWTDDLVEGEWHEINANHSQYYGEWVATRDGSTVYFEWEAPLFKVYMHPESETTKLMQASDSGFFRFNTPWNYEITKVDMEDFWE